MALTKQELALWLSSFPADQERALTALLTAAANSGGGVTGGTTAQRQATVIPSGGLYLDTDLKSLWAGDGSTLGGTQVSGAGVKIDDTVPTYADLPSGLTTGDTGTNRVVTADGKLYVWNGTAWPADGAGVAIRGPQGAAGKSLTYGDSVPTYTDLPSGLGASDAGTGYVVEQDGLLYVWSGSAFPANGAGAPFQGVQGPPGDPGPAGVGAPGPTGPAGSSNIPLKVVTGTSYTIAAGDAGSEIDMSNAANNTVSVPASVLSAGDMLLVRNIGTAKTTVQGSGGMQLLSSSGATAVLSQYQSCGIIAASATAAYLDAGSGASVAFSLAGTLPPGSVGVAYSAALTLSGTYTLPVTVTIPTGTMPSWMSKSITGSTITFSGMPDTAATTAFTVRGTDSSSTPLVANSAQSVVINAATTFTLAGTLPAGQVGVAYSANLTLGGSYNTPVVIDASAGSIPGWMTVTVTGSSVIFAGTPTTAETEAFTVRATDSSGTAKVATSAQSITISAAAPKASPVQFAASTTTASMTTRSATFASAPTPGNFIVALLGYNGSITNNSAPAGFTAWSPGEKSIGNARFNAYIHEVQSGDPSTYTFGWATAQYQSVLLYEVSSSSGTITAVGTGSTAVPPVAVSAPAEAGYGLALLWSVMPSLSSGAPTISAGWTAGAFATPNGDTCYSWWQNTVSSAGSSGVVSNPNEHSSTGACIIVIGA